MAARRTRPVRRVRRARTSPDAILDAALRVCARDGLVGATLGRVAEEAGTSKPSVLYHFGSLDGLRHQMANRTRERVTDLLFRAGAGAPENLVERGRALLAAVFHDDSRDLFRASVEMLIVGGRDPVIAAVSREIFDRAVTLVALFAGPVVGAQETAHSVVAAVQGEIFIWLATGGEAETHRAAAERSAAAILGPLLRGSSG